ncbi:hypothetical protein IFM89_015085 [Coptis chinensis]|uniref:Cleavage stimulation factor 50 kDa subunit n=1 Tax=Coptis chinensis TaxID=261450 RepID=A0A835IA71_9MAGN|nr:hypothetical protein IFM89_015085 [Coptis chinensis]
MKDMASTSTTKIRSLHIADFRGFAGIRHLRFILSSGKDSTVKLWEVRNGRLVKQYLGVTHTQLRCQAVFNKTEEFVLSIVEPNNEIVIWGALTSEKVARFPSNHIGAPRWLEHSPTEATFISCGMDRSVREKEKNNMNIAVALQLVLKPMGGKGNHNHPDS